MSKIKLIHGDCLERIKLIKDNSIHLFLTDLPYGKTRNDWDTPIDLSKLWPLIWKKGTENCCVILFGQDKFTAQTMLSDKNHRYNLIWEKSTVTGHLNAKRQPLRCHEDIMIFYKKQPTYNPQKTTGHKRKVSSSHHKRNSKKTTNYNNHNLTSYDSTERYPKSVLKFPTDKQKSAIHPTQKPVALLEYLIKSYSNENEIVCDLTSGSGSTGEASLNTNRDCILIENHNTFFDDSLFRLSNLTDSISSIY